jgi:phage repressor protein C with HTH and peptisase S24 domain
MRYTEKMIQHVHERIREILETRKDLTQKGLAERMGLNPAAVNRMLYGRRNIMAAEIPVIEDYLGVRLNLVASDPLENIEYRQDRKSYPPAARGFSEAAQQAAFHSPDRMFFPPVPVYKLNEAAEFLQEHAVDWVQRHPAQFGIQDAFALYVSSDAMEPRYFRGELVYVHPGRPPEAGRDCLVLPETGGAFIVRLIQETEKHFHVLQFKPLQKKDIARNTVRAIYAVVGRG